MFAVSALSVLFPVLMLAVILGFVAVMRYLKHREHMAMIQQGIAPYKAPEGQPARREARQSSLVGGLVTAFIGLAITLGLLPLGFGPWLIGGLIPFFVGLAILLAYFLGDERGGGKAGSGAGNKGGGDAQA
jgi:hypothetical protein